MPHIFSTAVVAVVATIAVIAIFFVNGAVGAAAVSATTPNPKPQNGWIKRVTTLPGLDGEKLAQPMYSGMIELKKAANPGQRMKMHYTFQVSSAGAGDDVPTAAFVSGGPGAPSSWSAFVESGAALLNEQSFTTEQYKKTGIATPIKNRYSYTNFAHMVYFDAPPPCGFSYCEPAGPAGRGDACGTWNDTRAGVAYAEAMFYFFTDHFPHLLPQGGKREWFAFCESYGGVYLSSTLTQLFTYPEYAVLSARLAGIAYGDACMGSDYICGNPAESKPFWFLQFWYGKGRLLNRQWAALMSECGEQTLKTVDAADLPAKCKAVYDSCVKSVGKINNVYNSQDNCEYNIFGAIGATAAVHRRSRQAAMMPTPQRRGRTLESPAAKNPTMNGFWCPANVFEVWVNRTDVKTAFGVPADAYYFIADNGDGMKYNFTERTSLAIVRDTLLYTNRGRTPPHAAANGRKVLPRPAGSPKIKVMSYNGADDAAVLMVFTQEVWESFATRQLGWNVTTEFSNWFVYPSQHITGGQIIRYGDDDLLSYATVSGSGHMVPEYKSREAEALMKLFIGKQ